MKSKYPSNPAFEELREKAEKISKRQDSLLAAEGTDLLHLAHELEVHRVELELQNQELQKAKGELEVSQNEYAELYDSAPVAYLTLDRKGRIERANPAAYQMFRHTATRLVGSRFVTWVYWDDFPLFSSFMDRLLSSEERSGHVELRLLGQRYRPFHVRLQAMAKYDRQEKLRWRFVLINITDRKEAEDALKKAHDELEEKVRERTGELQATVRQRDYLSRRLVDLLEKERAEIGYALHDEIGQIITGVSMQLEGWKKIRTQDGSLMADRVERVQTHLRAAVKYAKGLSNDLRSEALERFGLLPSINELVDETQRNCEINIRLFAKDIPQDLAERDKALTIYRVVQEALTNILKHADAKNIFVNLSQRDGKLFVAIEDDGVGFDYGTVPERKKRSRQHLGITIMRERTSMVGGTFQIESTPGKGTHILAEVPVQISDHRETETDV